MKLSLAVLSRAPAVLVCVIFAPLAGIMSSSVIRQNQAYHNFADQLTLLNIPHFYDVTTNLFFLFVALFGLIKWSDSKESLSKFVFLVGVLLVAPGSAYYHWRPTDQTLVWDRLPMVIGFCSLTCWVFVNYFKLKREKILLAFCNLVGLSSIFYWVYAGDLRLYYWVQLVPVLLLFYLSFFGIKTFNNRLYVFGAFALYTAAKITEHHDLAIFQVLGFSGHSIKHILSALAVLMLVYLEFNSELSSEKKIKA